MSLNSSVGWLGITSSPFRAFYASYLQQKLSNGDSAALVAQKSACRLLERLGTEIFLKRPDDGQSLCVSIVVFANAGRKVDYGQLYFLPGLVFRNVAENSVFHKLCWISPEPKCMVKLVGAAEMFYASEGIDEGKVLRGEAPLLFGVAVQLITVIDCKDWFTSLSTQTS